MAHGWVSAGVSFWSAPPHDPEGAVSPADPARISRHSGHSAHPAVPPREAGALYPRKNHGKVPPPLQQDPRDPPHSHGNAPMAHRCGSPRGSARFAVAAGQPRAARAGPGPLRAACVGDLPVLRLVRACPGVTWRHLTLNISPFYPCPSLPSRNVSQSRIRGTSLGGALSIRAVYPDWAAAAARPERAEASLQAAGGLEV